MRKNKQFKPLQSVIDKNKLQSLKTVKSRKSFKNNLSPVPQTMGSRKQSQTSHSNGSPARHTDSKDPNSLSPEQHRAKIRAAATHRPLHKKRVTKDQGRPNYFAMKGKIDTDTLKEKLGRDLLQNMKMAEKMGVFSVLRDMHFDAEEKLSWRERKKLRDENGELPLAHVGFKNPDPTHIANQKELTHPDTHHQ